MSVLQMLGSAADGGAETYFTDLAGALHRGGVSQAFAVRAHRGREAQLRALGEPVRVLPFAGPLDHATRGGTADLARATGARAIVAWMNRAATFSPKGPWKRIGRLGGYYKLKYYAGMDMLVANTADIAAWIGEQGWPADRIRYIPNFAAAGPGGALDRATLDTSADAPLLLSMGRLHPSKAHDVALLALALLPDACLWIAGSGPLEAQLKRLAHELGVDGRVRFLGWRSDASALYRAADVVLFPSRFEPLGNVVIQAWAHGTPIVAAASAGPAALIRDGEDGLLAPVDDAESLAAAVARLLDDGALYARLSSAGIARVAQDFGEDRVVAQWQGLLTELGAL
jgi:glycosyltransferase involved in cell wall biosynthesis